MPKIVVVIGLAVNMLFAVNSHADMIKYTDKNGTMCFVDDLGKVPKIYRKNIIREVNENQIPRVSEQNELPQQKKNQGDVVHICYHPHQMHINGSIYGRDLTDFLDARGYPYVMHIATDLDAARPCFELFCRKSQGSEECIRRYEKKFNPKSGDMDPMPFLAVGNRFFGKHHSIAESLDRYFHVDPHTPIKWKD